MSNWFQVLDEIRGKRVCKQMDQVRRKYLDIMHQWHCGNRLQGFHFRRKPFLEIVRTRDSAWKLYTWRLAACLRLLILC